MRDSQLHGNPTIIKTFRVLASIGRWLILFAILIILVGAFSYVFKFDIPQLASDILVGVLVLGLIVSSIMLLRVLWWSSNGMPMNFHEAWKIFAMKVQIFLSMIVSLLALPSFISLVRIEPDSSTAHGEALRMIRKAKLLNEQNELKNM